MKEFDLDHNGTLYINEFKPLVARVMKKQLEMDSLKNPKIEQITKYKFMESNISL